MAKSALYKQDFLILLMGAQEAAEFMRVLRHNGALSRRTVALYVMPALVGGPDVREGTEAHRELDLNLGRELSVQTAAMRVRRGIAPDEPLSLEATAYLHSLIDCVVRGNPDMLDPERAFNGFSREAYREVSEAIGRPGMDYLGITARSGRLNPSRRNLSWIRTEYLYAEDVPGEEEKPRSGDLSDGPWGEPFSSLPEPPPDMPYGDGPDLAELMAPFPDPLPPEPMPPRHWDYVEAGVR